MERMKHLKVVLLLFLAISIAGLPSFFEPLRLIRIQKGEAGLLGVLTRLQIDVIQELGTCFLARADRRDIRALRGSNVQADVLDLDSRGKSYLLLPSPSPVVHSKLSQRGHLLEIEAATFLFWTEAGDPAAALPLGLARKPLPTATILPYLKQAVSIEKTAGVASPVNDLVRQIADEISEDNLQGLVLALQNFQTRYVSTPNCDAAAQFIFNYYQALGLEVRFQDVTYSAGAVSRNVIAELPGRVYPGEILIICGHYDSISPDPFVSAPGADDNASGAAAAMEAARVLLTHPLDFTVRFIAFTAEEIGLFGSQVHAAEARARRENIIGVINLDMIAYPGILPEDLDIIVNPYSEWLSARFLGICEAYNLIDLKPVVDASIIYSDHSPFWDQGYAALLAIEEYPVVNPYYHGITDTIDTLDFAFYRDTARAALALLAELAQPVRVGYPVAPEGLTAISFSYSSLFHSFRNIQLSWNSRPGAAGYNVYRSSIPHQGYQQLNSSPLATTAYLDRSLQTEDSYYYVVTTVAPDGKESNYSRQASAWAEVGTSVRTLIREVFDFRGVSR